MNGAYVSGDAVWRKPITGIAGCCARAASGQATATPQAARCRVHSWTAGGIHDVWNCPQKPLGHLEKFFSPSRCESDSLIAMAMGGWNERVMGQTGFLAKLVASIASGRRWLDEIISGAVTDVEQIAAREKCSVRKVNMTISLGFLAPDLVKAAIEGRLPRGLGVARLCDCPAEWSRQYQILGLPSP